MSKTKTNTRINTSSLVTFGLPLTLIAVMVLITRSKVFEAHPDALSVGVTIDLLFTIPFVYFLLIKKKNIPKTTVVSFFVLGVLISSFIIPQEQQFTLNWAKTWIFPIVELSVASYVFYKVRKTILRYKANAQLKPDFFTALKETCIEILPRKAATLVAMELAVFYYGFIAWKKRTIEKNEFTYHKNSGTIALLLALILIIGVETYTIHILLLKWNVIAAWIASGLSIYSGIQIFGFLKSIAKRPIVIDDNILHLRYGILSETSIEINSIETIEITSKDIEFDTKTRKLSPLGELEGHNMVITLKNEQTLIGLYGIEKTYKRIAFFIDTKEEFKTTLEDKINATSSNLIQ